MYYLAEIQRGRHLPIGTFFIEESADGFVLRRNIGGWRWYALTGSVALDVRIWETFEAAAAESMDGDYFDPPDSWLWGRYALVPILDC
jgi:hypothetical protein